MSIGLGSIGGSKQKKTIEKGKMHLPFFIVLGRFLQNMRPRPLRIAILLLFAVEAGAQPDPSLRWQTLKTEHFRVSFSPGLEETARRAAGSAERAHAELSKDLTAPRSMIHLVVTDNQDNSNGYATPQPVNQIVIFARPTIDAGTLKFVDDWIDMVVVHELAHIFHLDRARGLWSVARTIFGRNPFLFPNGYSPSWLSEGLAVHFESKLTGSGRLVGTDFDAIARAHALSDRMPLLNQLSAGSTIWPTGNIVYTYGGPLMDEMARRKPGGLREFVDATAAGIPFLLNGKAKKAFGISFDSLFRLQSDSIRRDALRLQGETPTVKPLVTGGWFSQRPRWVDNETIIWAGADLRSVPALKQVNVNDGKVSRLSERNSNDATTPLPNGVRVFAQQEVTDPYTQRTDLYLEQNGSTRRLTHGARLTHPDARVCGSDICVIAVQLTPGEARLAHIRISGDSVEIRRLTEPSAADLLSDPRWSHSGDRIAVTHWQRGGMSAIDILDANGRLVKSISRSRSVTGTPSWAPGDSAIYFTSDRNGRSALYRANVSTGAVTLVAQSATGLFESEPSPDGTRLATFQLGIDGFNLALVDARARGTPAEASSVLAPSKNAPVARSDAPVVAYSAWRSVLPQYWEPVIGQVTENNYQYGFQTEGADVVGRHSWALSAAIEPKNNEPTIAFNYGFAGFRLPFVSAGAEEFWQHFALGDSTGKQIGTLRRRRITADAALTLWRPRVRSSVSLTVGTSYEWRRDDTQPSSLIFQLDPLFRQLRTYPSVYASASFANARRPRLALGAENGIRLGATYRQRWRSGAENTTRARSIVGTAAAFRGIDFGGWAHHLVGLRVAGATTDPTSVTDFSVGGNSGGVVDIAPGVTIGDGTQTFFVRGAEPGAQAGSRAMGASAEYRFPISLPNRGFWRTPLFFQRISGALFTDAGTAWCPKATSSSPICIRATDPDWLVSAGGELHVDLAVNYDTPIRFRLGGALPLSGSKYFGGTGAKVYLSLGTPF
jgi:hypothetical protein